MWNVCRPSLVPSMALALVCLAAAPADAAEFRLPSGKIVLPDGLALEVAAEPPLVG